MPTSLSDPPPIEVVEPTLADRAGHCAALMAGIGRNAPDLSFRLWADRRAAPELLADLARLQVVPHFSRRLRKPQAWWLYRRLLRAGGTVFVPTASYFDLRALDLAAGPGLPAHRAHFYFHKLRLDPSRTRALAALARRQPGFELFGTSAEIVARLQEAGFAQVRRVLPVLTVPQATPPGRPPLRALLFAGAARADKGFAQVVEMAALLAQETHGPTLEVQVTGDHYGRHDAATQAALARLASIDSPRIQRITRTLGPAEYAAQFPGTICLQPYDRAEYADKMSAVTFDALQAGAPVVTTAGTTMARIVEETGAGVVAAGTGAAALRDAVRQVQADYAHFQERALQAAEAFRPAGGWAPLIERLRLAGEAAD
jgi:glycosyltransferase involved in cell wall biosynthesis